jgi:hypothetical protein
MSRLQHSKRKVKSATADRVDPAQIPAIRAKLEDSREYPKRQPRFLTLNKTAEILGISYQAARRAVIAILGMQHGGSGRSWLVPRSAILAYLDRIEPGRAIVKPANSPRRAIVNHPRRAQLTAELERLPVAMVRAKPAKVRPRLIGPPSVSTAARHSHLHKQRAQIEKGAGNSLG